MFFDFHSFFFLFQTFLMRRKSDLFAMKFRAKKDYRQIPTQTLLFNHPLIASLHYVFHTDTKLFYVFDYAPAVQLLNFLAWRQKITHTEGHATLEEVKYLAAQLIHALTYLQSKGFTYTENSTTPPNISISCFYFSLFLLFCIALFGFFL